MSIEGNNSPIIACSTGSISNSAIAIIRISGKDYLHLINHLFNIDLLTIKPRYATYCSFLDFSGEKVDDIVLTYFKGPNSYNGEDILELGVHGNQINIERIISDVVKIDTFKRAKPGEFTLRALNHGKLSLNQVEGLDLLLNANNIFSLKQGFSLLSGRLKDSFISLHKSYLKHRSSVEFGFDFLDDIGEEQFLAQLNSSFTELKNNIHKLYSHVANDNFSLIKPEIVLYGMPNAGKSTLFNLLLKSDRAITSEIAGTTRDFLREDIRIGDNIFSLIDTAGIRSTLSGAVGGIEAMGINRAIKLASDAFYKILIINPFEFDIEYFSTLKNIEFDEIIITHSDSVGFEGVLADLYKQFSYFGPIEPKKDGPIEPRNDGPIEPRKDGPIEPKICNLLEDTSGVLQEITVGIHRKYLKLVDFDPILIQRHSESIKNIYHGFSTYEEVFNVEDDMAVIASELSGLGHCISELLGIVSVDDVLHNIFENFCIGK